MQLHSAKAQVFTAQTATLFVALVLLLLTTGCASTRLIESQVTTFTQLATAPAGATYKFDRLPSQQLDAQRQDQQEAIAQAALDKIGLQRVGDAPGSPAARYRVQMALSMQRTDGVPWDGWGVPVGNVGSAYVSIGVSPGFYYGHRHGHGHGYVGGFALWPHAPWGYGYPAQVYFVREVSLVLRDTASGQAVYETRARHAGRWADSAAVLPAMLDAALQGFPAPPAGVRNVTIEIDGGEVKKTSK
jgi:Domain of unknown function (DUF4136)